MPESTAAGEKHPIELSLFAPTIEEASLIADFNDWVEQPMQKGEDGNFRIRVELADGEYRYRFRVKSKSWFFAPPNEWQTLTDPKATRIDKKDNNGVLRVAGGQVVVDLYQWKHDAVPLPPNNQLVIYELHVRDFSGGEADPLPRGRFEHVVEKLDYLSELGVNCLELMPVKAYPGDYSWGYNPQNLFATEPNYGNSEDLKRLVDEAHGKGMRVILDGVYNHCQDEAPLTRIDHDYWFHHQPRDPSFSWGPQYNYELRDEKLNIQPARKFVSENIAYWVREYHIDGIRYDAARQIENFDALRLFSRTARATAGTKAFINIGEYIPEDAVVTASEDAPMDSCWHDRFFHCIADGILIDRPIDFGAIKSALDPSIQGFKDCTQVVNYLSNHDHRRLMPRLAEHHIFEGGAFGRAHLASTLLLTAVGIPMLWMGGEFGEYHARNIEPSKIDWTVLKNEVNRNLFLHYKRMIELRKTHPALQQNFIRFFHEDADNFVLGYVRWTEGGQRVVVIANFRDVPHEGYRVPQFPVAGEWHDWIADKKVSVGGDGAVISLGGLEAKVLVWE